MSTTLLNDHGQAPGQGATFVMADGTRGDLPADFVLYYCDPTYDWSPINFSNSRNWPAIGSPSR